MEQVQDIVIRYVQDYLADRLKDVLTYPEIGQINEDVEMKILAAFYERGITSPIK